MKRNDLKKHSLLKMRRHIIPFCMSMVFIMTGMLFSNGKQVLAAEDAGYTGGGAAVSGQTEEVGYATKLYDATNGLPTSDANAICATSDGFIWIGGYSGLVRYDGTSFQRQDSSSGVANANAIYEDKKKRLWVGTNDNGIVMLENGKSTQWDYKEGLGSSSMRSITEDESGNIIIGTKQGIYYIDQELKLQKLDDEQINNAYIIRLTSDEEGNVYGNTRSGAIFCIKKLRVDAYFNGSDLGVGEITTIYPSKEESGAVYLGTNISTLCLGRFGDNFQTMEKITIDPVDEEAQPSSGESEEASEDKPAVENYKINWIDYASNRLWLIMENSVGYLDEEKRCHLLKNLPMNNSIGAMTSDYEGNLWFTSDRQGVMKIVANKFTNVTERAALETMVVNSTCLHDGLLYIGTDQGIQIVDGTEKIADHKLKQYLGDSRIRCIMEDKDKNLWISTYTNDKGVVCYTADGKIKSFTKENGLLSNEVRCTAFASDGSVLAATNGGLAIIKDGKVKRTVGADSGMGNTVILTMEEGEDGKYYLGTDGGGVYVIDGNKISRKGREDGLTSDIILRIKKDEKRGVYWIITSNSIEYMKDGKVTEIKSFPYTNNYDVCYDENDNLWILSSYGIYVVNAQEMLKDQKFEYLFYGTSNGLPCVPTANAYNELDENGTLYISGRMGVSSVNINHYFEKMHDIKLSVPYVEANGVRYFPDQKNKVTLPSEASVVTIYGYAITYSMQNPKIQYLLKGFDKEAVRVTKQEMEPVRYTNLSGGTYSFQLSVVNNSTNSIQQTMVVTIEKKKAFYERVWFYILCGLLIAFCIAVLVTLYIHRKTRLFLKKEEENRIFVREMIQAFAKTIDMKDKYTNGHSARVAEYTAMLTRELGYDEETVEKYYNIALLHDIGKIGIPPEVLNKPGKLTDEEFQVIKSHSALGYNVLKDISIMPDLAIGAGAHHERPDGKGYPKGLVGDQIPRVAQIIAVADTFDAMYSNRPYRKRMNFEKVISIIKEVSGTQLESDVVNAFLRLVAKGKFKDPDDDGGGTMEDINNIRKNFEKEEVEAKKRE